MKTLEQMHAELKFLVDFATFRRHFDEVNDKQYGDTLQFVLWQVGLASGGLLLLFGGLDKFEPSRNVEIGIAAASASVCFIASIVAAIRYWSSQQTALISRATARMNILTSVMMNFVPQGLDGRLSERQSGELQRMMEQATESVDVANRIYEDRIGKLSTHGAWLSVGYILCAYIIVQSTIKPITRPWWEPTWRSIFG